MDMYMDVYFVGLIISFFIVLVLLFLYLKQRDELSKIKNYTQELLQKNSENKLELAVLKERYENEKSAANEKLDVLKNAKEELSREFKNLANQIFEDKSRQFSHTQKEQLDLFLKPFREQITHFSQQSKEQYTNELKERHLLKDELSRLQAMNAQLSQDALNLTNALKGENKTQGNWGELVLERILEQSGLREGSEYELQASRKAEDGKRYQPDVIIHLPQERDVIIDSKVSLVAYERFMSADSPEEKANALKEHLASISMHIKSLSAKKYERLQGVVSLDFVLLFMPIEGAFLLALEQDGEFFKRAFDQNILVVSPSTLLVTLRTIEHIWRTQRQEEHAKKIVDEAEAMYDKLVLFISEMENIGNHLQKTQHAYEGAMKRLHTGRGNVIKRAQNMIELGLKPKKNLTLQSEDDAR
jgi:DNA recombination protein RmuC